MLIQLTASRRQAIDSPRKLFSAPQEGLIVGYGSGQKKQDPDSDLDLDPRAQPLFPKIVPEHRNGKKIICSVNQRTQKRNLVSSGMITVPLGVC